MHRTDTRTARAASRAGRSALALGASALLLLTAGCGIIGSGPDAGAAAAAEPHRIAFLIPQTSLRFAAVDAPNFQARVTQECPTCTVDVYRAADQDEQNTQAAQAVQEGAEALVVIAIDGAGAGTLATAAAAQDVPVYSYDRLIKGGPVEQYVSFDGNEVGVLGGQALLDALGDTASQGVVLWLNGDSGDNNAGLFAAGAHTVLDGKITVLDEQYVTGWSGDEAEKITAAAIQQLDGRRLVGIYTAYDGLAAGAQRAVVAAGLAPVPVVGQDAEVGALQRILGGTQSMTVYKDLPGLARTTADLVVAQVEGKDAPAVEGASSTTTDNGAGAVPTLLLQPEAVTAANMADTVIADGYTTVGALCAGAASQSCTSAGLR